MKEISIKEFWLKHRGRIFYAIVTLTALEWTLVFTLNAVILRGNVHLEERLNSEIIDWDNIKRTSNWACKSYNTLLIYKYHTCFNRSGESGGYNLYKARPYLSIKRLFWPTDEKFQQVVFSTAGSYGGITIGRVSLTGEWQRCRYKRNRNPTMNDPLLCVGTWHYLIIDDGVWNNDYIE